MRYIGAVDTEGTQWIEVPEDKAQKLVDKHGGMQGDLLVPVEETDADVPLPYVENMASAQMFQAPDGFKIILITDDAHLEYFFVRRGTQYSGLKPWQYGVVAGVGALAGHAILNRGMRKMKFPWGALVGAGVTTAAAALTSHAWWKFNKVVEETVKEELEGNLF